MYEREVSLEKLKAVQSKGIEMLTQVIEICDKHSITYFVVGGSCLGAVRHGGFIPWDDDIDVAMPRQDYDNFLRVAQLELPDKFFLQWSATEYDYRNDFAKIRNSETTFIESSCKKLKINHGIYIDIFPIDGMPTKFFDKLMLNIHKRIARIYLGKDYVIPSKKKKLLRKIAVLISSVLCGFQKPSKVLLKLEKHYKKFEYENSNLVVCHGGVWGKREIHPRNQFGKGRIANFNGVNIVVPENTDEYLTGQYGDWHKLPPEEKRIPHHYCDVIDASKPYTCYVAGEIK